MKTEIKIKRGSIFEKYVIDCSEETSVASLLDMINKDSTDPVEWECSCRQNLCGACAMVINGRPALACASFVKDLGTRIRLEPLSAFPLIKDLKVDRSGIHRLLEKLEAYPKEGSHARSADTEGQYQASSCLMCGCCMEICPEYTGKDRFGSALGMNAMYRTVSQEEDSDRRKRLRSLYGKTQLNCCTNSLSCADVCPMHLPITTMMSSLNALNERMQK